MKIERHIPQKEVSKYMLKPRKKQPILSGTQLKGKPPPPPPKKKTKDTGGEGHKHTTHGEV